MVSVIVSCFNEEECLNRFYSTCIPVLDACSHDYELIFINDGSTDGTLSELKRLASENERVRVISFSRNFGHEAAMMAGIDVSKGEAVICMDADLQHPPKRIPDIISCIEEGYDIVLMIRTENKDTGLFRKFSAGLFYKVLGALSDVNVTEYSSDYFGLSARAAKVLKTEYRERVRYLRGLVQNIGFRRATLEFEVGKRESGKSRYRFSDLLKLSVNAMCGNSYIPLKIGIYAGFISAACGVILMIYSLMIKTVYDAPSGYMTIIVALCFLFSLTLIVLGIIGEYISVLLQEVKGRPIYIVEETLNIFDDRQEK